MTFSITKCGKIMFSKQIFAGFLHRQNIKFFTTNMPNAIFFNYSWSLAIKYLITIMSHFSIKSCVKIFINNFCVNNGYFFVF